MNRRGFLGRLIAALVVSNAAPEIVYRSGCNNAEPLDPESILRFASWRSMPLRDHVFPVIGVANESAFAPGQVISVSLSTPHGDPWRVSKVIAGAECRMGDRLTPDGEGRAVPVPDGAETIAGDATLDEELVFEIDDAVS